MVWGRLRRGKIWGELWRGMVRGGAGRGGGDDWGGGRGRSLALAKTVFTEKLVDIVLRQSGLHVGSAQRQLGSIYWKVIIAFTTFTFTDTK